MNARALTIAKGFLNTQIQSRKPVGDTLHIYDDGLVVVLNGTSDRHLLARQMFQKPYPHFEEARAGDVSVFVVPMDVPYTFTKDTRLDRHLPEAPDLFIAMTNYYHDHRLQDWHTLADVEELQRRALEIAGARAAVPDGQHRHG